MTSKQRSVACVVCLWAAAMNDGKAWADLNALGRTRQRTQMRQAYLPFGIE